MSDRYSEAVVQAAQTVRAETVALVRLAEDLHFAVRNGEGAATLELIATIRASVTAVERALDPENYV